MSADWTCPCDLCKQVRSREEKRAHRPFSDLEANLIYWRRKFLELDNLRYTRSDRQVSILEKERDQYKWSAKFWEEKFWTTVAYPFDQYNGFDFFAIGKACGEWFVRAQPESRFANIEVD